MGVSPDGTLLVDTTVGVEVSKDIVGVGHTWHFAVWVCSTRETHNVTGSNGAQGEYRTTHWKGSQKLEQSFQLHL